MTMRIEFEKVLPYCEKGIGLNIGCGGARVGNSIGIDIDGTKRACIIIAKAWELPVADSSIDYIVSMACIEHLDRSLLTVLREWQRVLKIGGKCIVTTPEGSVIKSDWALAGCSDHLNLFTLPQLELHFKVAGFNVEHSETIDRRPGSQYPTIMVVGIKK